MANPILKKLFGTQNDRTLKQIQPLVNRINELEPLAKKLSDDELKAKTSYFRERFAKGESVDDLLPEVFSISREASFRILGMRAYDVQLIGGIVLHQGKIAEMKTGEGKTLTAVAPCYLNGLTGKGVHVVTVNDYLAKRDSEWMGGIHRFMGLSVGNIIHGMTDQERKASYGSDITYGQNNEFGFDYLRDNMKFRIEDYVQRDHHFAIVDEVDSILIDEARTPLIISGPAELSTEIYYQINSIMPLIIKDPQNYAIEEKTKSATLTDEGIETAQRILKIENLFDPVNIETLHSLNQALRAHTLYKTDVDYVVNNGEVIIVDEFTGRMMPGRRWSDGLHQAIEAKEGVRIENENQTLASITFQNYFRMYDKLSGMTGTADTEATEFKKIYNLDVVVIPTNRPLARTDKPDVVYKNIPGKFRAITKEIKESHDKGQPVLVGTVSIEKSELLSAHLKAERIPHNVLNAKQHEKEATFVAQAGRKGAVTIATNMAGRGTDIVLGGNAEFMAREEATRQGINPTEQFEQYEALIKKFEDQCEGEKREVIQAGGLHIIGTERHESRRIDNQLRGRSGRQGDPGSSRFYLCLEDDLMRIFGAERIQKFMNTFGMEEDEPIEHKLVTKAIENAQKKVEGHNYDIRKHLLEYDDVMNQQRKVIYELRRRVLEGKRLRELIFEMIEELVDEMTGLFWIQRKPVSEWNFKGINEAIRTHFAVDSHLTPNDLKGSRFENLYDVILEKARIAYEAKEAQVGETIMRDLEKMVFLQTIDHLWKDHLLQMDHLKEGIGLRGYAQKDPLLEYKKEGFELFERMKFQIKFATISRIMEVQLLTEEEVEQQRRQFEQMEEKFADQIELQRGPVMSHNKELGRSKLDQLKERQEREAEARLRAAREAGGDDSLSKTVKRDQDKVGRNDPCPCGSGKKYKKCHGQ